MGLDLFLLLLGFTLLKMAVGLALVWQGLRSAERPAGGEGWDGRGPPRAPRPPRDRPATARRPERRPYPRGRPRRRSSARAR